MFSLIMKDISIQWKYAFFLGLFTVCSFVFLQGNIYILIPVWSVMLLTMGSAGIEEKNNSEKLVVSFPVKRSTIVFSKYMSVLVYYVWGVLLAVSLGSLLTKFGMSRFSRYMVLEDLMITIVMMVLYACLYLPIYFKFGYRKSKIYNFLMVMLPSMATLIISDQQDLVMKLDWLLHLPKEALFIGMFLILLVVSACSISLSMRFYQNREF